ncbi:hypothetical protein CEE44_00075 [Candidatus Woesearchaeota archaeon B3_Woes]|nr:MAG: hypothetical protein CEE44_00075 [Candidatus Woesearchaeota archaeon B3_Woes]
MKKTKNPWTIPISISVILLIIVGVIFLVPIPYTAVEIYTETEPYITTEKYTDTEPYMGTESYQEQIPITEEECKTDISSNPLDYINRGLDILLNDETDYSSLLETCENVIKFRTITKSKEVVKYRTVEKERQVTRYRDVQKERTVTKTATLYMRWSGQVQYRYEV